MTKQCQAERSRSLKPNQFLLPSGAIITERPLLYQTEMVKAVLEDRKTVTRRTQGLEKYNECPNQWTRDGAEDRKLFDRGFQFLDLDREVGNYHPLFEFKDLTDDDPTKTYFSRPRLGSLGDLIWVRETWLKYPDQGYAFKASTDPNGEDLRKDYVKDGHDWAKWKPSIHMPKEASRIWLMVEDIRVERVQEISQESAIAEGIKTGKYGKPGHWRDGFYVPGDNQPFMKASEAFEQLWWNINGEESWNSNPWVWVIQFRVLSKAGRPSMATIEENYKNVIGRRNDEAISGLPRSATDDGRKEASHV